MSEQFDLFVSLVTELDKKQIAKNSFLLAVVLDLGKVENFHRSGDIGYEFEYTDSRLCSSTGDV